MCKVNFLLVKKSYRVVMPQKRYGNKGYLVSSSANSTAV